MNKYFSDTGEFIGELPSDCIAECSASGNVYDAVSYWQRELDFRVPRYAGIVFLVRTGAWTARELRELDDNEISIKVLWLACCDIKENGEWLGLNE